MPKVSVLISAFNAEAYINQAVDSVLAQSFGDFELLVMDDGSSDSTFKCLAQYHDARLQVFRQENAGKSAAINKLIAHASGEYLTLLDADDACDPDRLKVLSEFLDDHSHVGLVQSGYSIILDNKICAPRRTHYREAYCKRQINNFQMPALDPTLMVRMHLARQFRFDEALRIGEGLDFILKVGEISDIYVLPHPLYHYRFHFNSITKQKADVKAQYLLRALNIARQRRGMEELTMGEYLRRNKRASQDKLNNLSGHFLDSAYWSVIENRRRESRETAMIALKWFFRTGDRKFLKPLVYAFSPLSLSHKLRTAHVSDVHQPVSAG